MGVALEIWKEGIFGIGCLAMGLMLSLGLVSKKLPFWLGLTGPVEPGRGEFGPRKKKIRLVNRLSPGRGSWPTSRVRLCKNLAQTRPIAIPITKANAQSVQNLIMRGP